jgi:toxin ParE1/3/4
MMGRRYGFTDPEFESVRVWHVRGFRNYLIFYRPIDNGVEVVRVLHGARDIEKEFRRSK